MILDTAGELNQRNTSVLNHSAYVYEPNQLIHWKQIENNYFQEADNSHECSKEVGWMLRYSVNSDLN